MKSSVIPVFIPHAGCPHDCVFCDQKRIAGRVCAPTPEQVRKDVSAALQKRHSIPPQVAFYGGSFTAIPTELQQEYLGAVAGFVADGEISGVRVSTRPDFISDEILSRLKAGGVETVELGVQSFCDEVLNASGRGHTALDAARAAECVRRNRMELVLQLMAGLPRDTRERAVFSAKRAAELMPDGVRIYPVAVIENTRLADMYLQGKYSPLGIEDAVEWSADMTEVFIENRIPVIRTGLNTSETLSESVIAGAYHPALGELVKSRVYLRRALQAVEELQPKAGSNLLLRVAKGRTSMLCGQHSANRKLIIERFGLSFLRVEECELPKWCVTACCE